jgi:hypothetical protein
MIELLASELSPAQALIRETDCFDCQSYLLITHFQECLQLVDQYTEVNSWQRKRLYALLSPMYLEVIQEIKSQKDDGYIDHPQPLELLIEMKRWSDPLVPCQHLQERTLANEHLSVAIQKMGSIFQDILGYTNPS